MSARRGGGGATGLAGYDTPKLPSAGVTKMFSTMDKEDAGVDINDDVGKQKGMSKTVEAPSSYNVKRMGATGNLNG